MLKETDNRIVDFVVEKGLDSKIYRVYAIDSYGKKLYVENVQTFNSEFTIGQQTKTLIIREYAI